MNAPLTPEQFQQLKSLDACLLSNAIESFQTRLRNEGYADHSLHCWLPDAPPMLGYAATVKVRGSAPPMAASQYPDRTDWWDYIQTLPAPRVVVVQDVSSQPGTGSLLGTVHINILQALSCVGAVTNGSVRDLPAARQLGFQLFSQFVSVSHSYIHIVEFGKPVEVAGLKVQPGDLVHGDVHGIQTVPRDIAARVPAVAAGMAAHEQAIIQLCQSKDFTVQKLRAIVAPNHS